MTIGQRLRAARESHRMTLGDVARRTYMQPRFLQAIEEDNLGVIPESHRRLFVREFAKVVGINAEELYPLLDSIAPAPTQGAAQRPAYTFVDGETEPESTPSPTYAPPPPRKTERSLPDTDRPSLGSVVRGVSEGVRDRMTGEGGPRALIGIGIVLIVLVGGYFLFKAFTGKEATPPPGTTDTTSQVQVIPRSDDTTASTDAGMSEDSLTLVGRTTGKVWFSLVADNQRTQSGTLDSGVERRWRADKTFRLSLSNAGDLNLSLNGRSLGALGPKKTSVRNVTIDSAGVKSSVPVPPSRGVRRAQPRAASSTTPRRTTPTLQATPPQQ